MDGSKAIMGIFKSFADNERPKIRLIKTGCVSGHVKIPIGQIVEGTFVREVKVGESFNLFLGEVIEGGGSSLDNLKGVKYDYWCTSVVQKIISDDTFETKNSVYKLEIILKK